MSTPDSTPFGDTAREIARHILPLLNDREFLERSLSPWLTVPEAAAYLGITEDTIRHYIKRKLVPYHRATQRMIRFKRADLDAWLEAARVEARRA